MDDISSWGIRSPGHLLDFLLLPWIGAEAQVAFKDVWLSVLTLKPLSVRL